MKMMPVLAALAVLLLAGYAYAGNFTDNGNGTVTDNTTGLTWQKCSAGQNNDAACSGTAQTYEWWQAYSYCKGLSLAGYRYGWRLPNIKELESIVDLTAFNPTINTTYFPNTQTNFYQSSSTDYDGSSDVWAVYFYHGVTTYLPKTLPAYVRCVR